MRMKAVAAILLLSLMAAVSAACDSDADVASKNLSAEAEQFRVLRRIVFFNGITDKYLLEIQGYCSVETGQSLLSGSLEVTCKVAEGQFKKHFLGLSDNVSFFVEQVENVGVSTQHYKVVFKPSVIVPDFEVGG